MPLVLQADRQWQAEIIESAARVMVVMGGRGSTKTTCLARNRLIRDSLRNENHEYGYFSPSYSIAKRERKAMAKNRILKGLITDTGDQPFPFIEWISGSKLYFRSLDREENLLGYHLNGAVLDEIHESGEATWDQILHPQLGAKRGWALWLGQHDEDGEEGWINKRGFIPGQAQGQKDIRSWRIPSSMSPMYDSPEGLAELERIRRVTPELVFRRQYLAEPIESENKAFRAADVENCLADIPVKERASEGEMFTGGYDLGKVVDPSALVILQAFDREHAAVSKCGLKPLNVKHEMQAVELGAIARVFGDLTMMIDATGQRGAAGGKEEGDCYSQFYRKHCPSARAFYITPKNKTGAVQSLQLAIEQRRLLIPRFGCEKLVDQLKRYRWEMKSGAFDFHGPDGHDDDLVMALVMAWYAVERGWFGAANPKTLAGIF